MLKAVSRFMRENQLKRRDIDDAVRRALVEVYTLKEAGLDPTISTTLEDDRGLEAIGHAEIFQGKDGHVRVEWDDSDMRGRLVQALTTPFSPLEEYNTSEGELETMDEELVEIEPAVGFETPPDVVRPTTEDTSKANTTEVKETVAEVEKILASTSANSEIPETLSESGDPSAPGAEPAVVADDNFNSTSWRKIRLDDSDIRFAVWLPSALLGLTDFI